MKRFTSLLFLVAFASLIMSSCKKEDAPETKTINVQLNANESYSSWIPAGDADDVMQIATQAQHSSVSTLSADPGTRTSVFHYTPAKDYTGTDEVQITNSEGSHGGYSHGGGSCSHHHDDNTTYIYKITIKAKTSNG